MSRASDSKVRQQGNELLCKDTRLPATCLSKSTKYSTSFLIRILLESCVKESVRYKTLNIKSHSYQTDGSQKNIRFFLRPEAKSNVVFHFTSIFTLIVRKKKRTVKK